jgi:hypothetical protein
MGVDRGGSIAPVPYLLLDEPPVDAVLGQVRHIRVPDRMRRCLFRQPQSIPVGDEPGVDLRRLHPAAALGHPQRRMISAPEPGPDVLHVIGHRLDRPPHHRGDVAPPGRLPAHRLAVTHMQHPVPAELRRRRITAPVRDIELGSLSPAQPPPVDDLEQRRVPVSRQRALAPSSSRPLDLPIGIVQEQLQFLPRQRPGLRAALIVVQVRDRVPLMADRHRMHPRPERPLTCRRPPVTTIGQVLAEQPQLRLVAADRRWRQLPLAGQRHRPFLHVRRAPPPRVLRRELKEPADQPLPRRDRVLLQAPGHLLRTPPAQHRIDHRVLRAQLNRPGDQLQMRRTRQIGTSQPQPRFPRNGHRPTPRSCT